MTDENIIKLFAERSEGAVKEAEKKYRAYCFTIANNILQNAQDAEECVSDAMLAAWNTIPPARPEKLSAYLGRLTRNSALKKYRDRNAEKRGGGEPLLALDELMECISSRGTVEKEVDSKAIGAALDRFLSSLPDTQRRVFVCRYWYMDSIEDISRRFRFSESKTKSMLLRLRGKLMKILEKEGITL